MRGTIGESLFRNPFPTLYRTPHTSVQTAELRSRQRDNSRRYRVWSNTPCTLPKCRMACCRYVCLVPKANRHSYSSIFLQLTDLPPQPAVYCHRYLNFAFSHSTSPLVHLSRRVRSRGRGSRVMHNVADPAWALASICTQATDVNQAHRHSGGDSPPSPQGREV